MTRMRDKTGRTAEVYHWLLEPETSITLAYRAAHAAKREHTCVVFDRDGKHNAVAIAEATAAILRKADHTVRLRHLSLESRPPMSQDEPDSILPPPAFDAKRMDTCHWHEPTWTTDSWTSWSPWRPSFYAILAKFKDFSTFSIFLFIFSKF